MVSARNLLLSSPLRVFAFCLAVNFALCDRATLAAQTDEATPKVQQLYAEAHAAQQSGNSATAIEKYRAMLQLAPHLAPAYNNLGMVYFNSHDYPHAAETLARGLELDPNMTSAQAMLGMSYLQMGEAEKAEAPLEAALRNSPTDDLVQMALARDLIRLNRFEQAAAVLHTYTQRTPKDQEAW